MKDYFKAETLAVDIGGTYVKYGVIHPGGKLEGHFKIPTPEVDSSEAFYDAICQPMKNYPGIQCIGVSAPGLVTADFDVKSYAAPRVEPLFQTNVRREVESRMHLPTAAINDAKAAGLCELKLGRARGTKLSAYLIIGTGGGGCICNADDVFGGADNFAGEFHFLSYYDPNTGEDMKTGRLLGMMGLVQDYNCQVTPGEACELGREVIERAFMEDAKAKAAVDGWIHKIALQCLNIAVVINPEMICIGGGISEEDWFLERVRREYAAICQSHFNHADFLTTKIERCLFCNDANLLGAGLKVNMYYL